MSAETRAELHELIDQLPEDTEILSKIRDTVVRELELRAGIHQALEARGTSAEEINVAIGTIFRLRRPGEPDREPTAEDLANDPLLDVLMNAPEDDEPLTAEDLAAIAEGKAAADRGDVVAWEDYNPNRRRRPHRRARA